MASQAPPPPENSASFAHTDTERHELSGPGSPRVYTGSEETIEEEPRGWSGDGEPGHPQTDLSLSQALEEVDRFLGKLPASNGAGENDDSIEIPDSVEILSKMVESMIEKCSYPSDGRSWFCHDNDLDSSAFFDAIDCLSKLTDKLGEVSPSATALNSLNRTSAVLQRTMLYLEDELRNILEHPKDGGGGKSDHHRQQDNSINQKNSKSTAKHSSFNSLSSHHELMENRLETEPAGGTEEELFPGFSPDAVLTMNKVATAMIRAGYESECCIIYSIMRRNSFKSVLINLGFEIVSIDDLQKMQWESLEGEIMSWIRIVKECSTTLFAEERKLCDSVFSNHLKVSGRLFGNLARAVCIQFLNFAEAAVLTKRSAEKLFKFLDMYEAIRDLGCSICRDGSGREGAPEELVSEIESAQAQIGEMAVGMFGELETSIQSDNGRTPVPSGAVHPLTRYTMNYLEYACVYKETLEQVFHQHRRKAERPEQPEETGKGRTEFGKQLIRVMELLDSNLETKSRLYRDPSLRYIFLMNNGRYILQKIKGSAEIHEVMGDTWCRKRSTDLRSYHKNYQRETWYRLLQCLTHEGLSVNGKVSKPVLKERFKSFNSMFDDIHKTQSTWVVSDEQLQSELRVSISAVVTPAYRSFLGRFNQYLDPGRQSEKYIKYQPEDIESLIDELFDGNPTSMGRRRT